MTFKPNDFLLGLVELLGFMVPGMILFVTMPKVFAWNDPEYLTNMSGEKITTLGWIAFFLLSYIFGHFIHHIGTLILNPIYERTYYRMKFSRYSGYLERTEKDIKETSPMQFDLLRTAEAYIRCNQLALIVDLEKLLANSKLFRAITVLCFYLCFYPGVDWGGRLLLVVIAFFSFIRFANQRWKHRLLAYEYFSILYKKNLPLNVGA